MPIIPYLAAGEKTFEQLIVTHVQGIAQNSTSLTRLKYDGEIAEAIFLEAARDTRHIIIKIQDSSGKVRDLKAVCMSTNIDTKVKYSQVIEEVKLQTKVATALSAKTLCCKVNKKMN